MCAPAAICVNDDLTPGQASITMWASNDKASCQCKQHRR